MTKYSEAFKLSVVQEYLQGHLGYTLLTRKYDLSTTSMLKRWVKAYQAFGVDGLRRRASKEVFTI